MNVITSINLVKPSKNQKIDKNEIFVIFETDLLNHQEQIKSQASRLLQAGTCPNNTVGYTRSILIYYRHFLVKHGSNISIYSEISLEKV